VARLIFGGPAVAGLMVAAAPVTAQEGELRYFAGVDVVSNYVASGVTQSDGKPAIQPFFTIAKNGFYAGTWMSMVDFGDEDNWEIDLYLGYRTLLENDLFVDFGYARYMYDRSGDCCGEVKMTLAYPLLSNLGLKGFLAYNPQSKDWNRRLTLAYEVNEQLGIAGVYGKSDLHSHDYWGVGASYAFDDSWAVGLSYQGSESGDEGVVFTVSLASSQSTLARLLAAPFQR